MRRITIGTLYPQLNQLHSKEYFEEKELENDIPYFSTLLDEVLVGPPDRKAVFYGLRKIVVEKHRFEEGKFYIRGAKIALSKEMVLEVIRGIKAKEGILRRKSRGGH